MSEQATIIYTRTDEAPALATWSLLPVIRTYCSVTGVDVELRDISLAGRIIATFPDYLKPGQRIEDALAELGRKTLDPLANIIKLPNISASIPQMKAAIRELQEKGHELPDYPDEPADEREAEIKARYDRVKGSAVNPVLREGNSDRRAPPAVKAYARKHPHSMGAWSADSASHVSSMSGGDFFGNEQSATVEHECSMRIEHRAADGGTNVLKEGIPVTAGEVVDASFMSCKALRKFLAESVAAAKADGVLFSLHLKATMMKVSDPIIFGHAVRVYFAELFDKHEALFAELGVDVNNGFGDLLARIADLPAERRQEIEADIERVYAEQPPMAMVDSDRGITNLHVPSDIIIDASMPAALRSSGKMWGPDGKLHDMNAVIPDRSYAPVYQQVIEFCKANGAFDPATMGSVPNVGLMAQKAEEYGSHDKTFEIASDGEIAVIDDSGNELFRHRVEAGDIWRMCQVRDAAIRDWVKLAVNRARATGAPAVFWLNEDRPHDAQVLAKVRSYLPEHDTGGLEIHFMAPAEAARFSLMRMKQGKDAISVTGNVLRDYLTDLFPILELGTSAKMLSIVPLMNGGGLFETGAGGSAPKHVQQFEKENHLRWDSLGEFLALAASLEHLAGAAENDRAGVLARALDRATGTFLENNKSPSRKVNELDNRGSHFYLAMYWARELAAQQEDSEVAERFRPLAEALLEAEDQIIDELNAAQGAPADVGGYYAPDPELASAAMRPSATFNSILESL
ncbi:MAG: NADP-dependent isocitrate dehydrogenase [Gammaproteobacteria bacterium]|nr:NADP-dependent isocitrate dehydrogenase [Gammaproteobacteria bacterium]MDE0479072.1 NADP-dependent isocitrate dehydrogenase [Gammaproteobacteria bacterium]MYE99574.1 NADP-dependent isocitrate dehydrogenase [Gammaproteobacteria bacterium]